jgi:hypothetical protein
MVEQKHRKEMTLADLLANEQKQRRRKHHNDDEHRMQVTCVRWFNTQYPALHGRLFAVPNGGRRDATTAAKLKAEGVVAGVSDLILLLPNKSYGALLIELKTPKGRQSPSQREWQRLITYKDEYQYIVVHSVEEFKNAINLYINNN